MRSFATMLAAWLLPVAVAPATTIASDDFTYADGSLYGQSGGSGWVAIWTGNGVDVVGQQAVSNVVGNPPKYGSRTFVNPAVTNALFVRFDLTVGSYALDDYIVAQLTTGVNNNILLWGKTAGSNELQVGNSGLSSTGITLAPNATTTLIAAYVASPGPGPDPMLLWVKPDAADFFDPTTGANSADAMRLDFVAFPAATISLYAEEAGVAFDDLLITDGAADVGLTVVPEPASVIQAALGLATLGTYRARRRSRRADRRRATRLRQRRMSLPALLALALVAAVIVLPRLAAAQPVTIALGVTSVAAGTPAYNDPTIYLASTPLCPSEAANGAFITRWGLGAVPPRALVAVNPARPPGTCNPYRLASNVHVEKDAIYYIDNQGPGGTFMLWRRLRTANAADPATPLVNYGASLDGAEVITYTASIFVILHRAGQNDVMWQYDKLTGAIYNLNVASGAPFQLSSMQVDSRYLYWLNAGVLWRNDLTNGNQVQIATGVTSYYNEGYSEDCSPLGCTQLSRVLYGKQNQLLDRYNLDSPFTLYTSPDPGATITGITRDGTKYYFFERRPVPGGGFDRNDRLLRLPVGNTTPALLYGPINNGGPGFDSLHTDVTWLYFRNRQTRELQRLPNDAAALPVYALRATGIEITQGVQGMTNSVPMIQGRRTFVRLHVKSDGATSVPGVDAVLNVFDQDTQQFLGTLRPLNRGGVVLVRTTPARTSLDDSFYFELPIEWTRRSRLSFAGAVNPTSVLVENDYANNFIQTGAYEFAAPTRLPLHVVTWWYNFGNTFVTGGALEDWNSQRWIERVYPLPSSGGSISTAGDGLRTDSTVIIDDALAARVNRTGADCDALLTPATATTPAVDDRSMCAATYVLGRIRAMRAAGELPRGRYYYGSIAGQSGLTPFTRGFAPGSDTISMGPSKDLTAEQNYMAHEVGHTLGRGHPATGAGGVCGDQDASDPTYPYPRARIGNSITAVADATAILGFDFGDNRFVTPVLKGASTRGDIMSYCSPYWISDYNYVGIFDFLTNVQPSARAGGAGSAEALVAGDWLIANGVMSMVDEQAVFTTVQRRDEASIETEPASGDWRLELRSAGGALLAAHPFTPEPTEDESSVATFSFVVPFASGTREIRVVKTASGTIAASQAISASPPLVSDVELVGAPDPVMGIVTASWAASDPDADTLHFDVLLSRDGGLSFEPLALSVPDTQVELDSAAWGGGTAQLRVVASDGAQTTVADGASFTVADKAPIVLVASPAPDTALDWGQVVNFTATVEDPQDEPVPDASIVWSNAYRVLGTGRAFSVDDLEVGVNVVTVSATNAAGLSGEASVTVLVGDDLTLPGPRVSTLPATLDFSVAGGETELQTAPLDVVNPAGGVLQYIATSSATWLLLDGTSSTTGTAPQAIGVRIDPSALPDAAVSTAEILVSNALDLDDVVSVPVSVAKGDVVGGNPFTDSDGDELDDRIDNCPFVANAGQEDTGGLGVGSPPNGRGDACECGDVSGDGRVTASDAVLIRRALLAPPAATLVLPALCDVGGAPGCSTADAAIVQRALLTPPKAEIAERCARPAP